MPKPRRHSPRNAELLEWCETEFKRYLHIPDPGYLYVTLGTVVANCYVGMPVWLMLVGPSGCGKTVILSTVAAAKPEWFRMLSGASKAAFLSGTSKREKMADATGGVLQEIIDNDIHFIIIKEYGSILDEKKEDYNQITGMFREIWDGDIHRPVGSDGGRVLSWTGKVGNLAACTSRIDEVLAEETSRGVRWLAWRFPPSTGWQETNMAMEGKDPADMKEALANAISSVLAGADLTWPMEPRDLTSRENMRVMRVASLSAKLQGAVRRDKFHNWEVNGMPDEAYATRLGPALGRIYLGMEHIGVNEAERWRQIRKIAFDTAPALRVAVLREYVRRHKDGESLRHCESDIADAIRCGAETVRREVEDLGMLGVLRKEKVEGGYEYEVPAELGEEIL